jgi:hypothetical protein
LGIKESRASLRDMLIGGCLELWPEVGDGLKG